MVEAWTACNISVGLVQKHVRLLKGSADDVALGGEEMSWEGEWRCQQVAGWSLVPTVTWSLELLGCALKICDLPASGEVISGSTKMGEGKGCQGDGGLKLTYSCI